MKLSTQALQLVTEASDVLPGNIYPAKGGKGDTKFWLVVSTTNTGANLIGFNDQGAPVSTATYLKGAMRERPVIARCKNLDQLILEV